MRGFQPAPTARLDQSSPVRPARRGLPASSQVSQMSTPLPSRTTESCQVVRRTHAVGTPYRGPLPLRPYRVCLSPSQCIANNQSCAWPSLHWPISFIDRPLPRVPKSVAFHPIASLVHRLPRPQYSCVVRPQSPCAIPSVAAVQLCSPATLTMCHPFCGRSTVV